MLTRKMVKLRNALDRARHMLTARDAESAMVSLLVAGQQGPLPSRPTRVLWELTARCSRRVTPISMATLDPLFGSTGAEDFVLDGNDRRNRRLHRLAMECYVEALTLSPLSAEAIYKLGLTHLDLGDPTESVRWLDLVPRILGPNQRTDQFRVHFVADSHYRLARIDLMRGRPGLAARHARRALEVNAGLRPASDMLERLSAIRSLAGGQGQGVCPVCAMPTSLEPSIQCPACETPHHSECWAWVGHCSVYACGYV